MKYTITVTFEAAFAEEYEDEYTDEDLTKEHVLIETVKAAIKELDRAYSPWYNIKDIVATLKENKIENHNGCR